MTYQLFIDDIRNPPGSFIVYPGEDYTNCEWVLVRTSQDAIDCVRLNGPPEFISFDHDLGGEDTSMKFIHWLIQFKIDNTNFKFPTEFAIHSANPVGAKNIYHLMSNFIRFLNVESSP